MALNLFAIIFGFDVLENFEPLTPAVNLLFLVAVHSWASTILACIPAPRKRRTDFEMSKEEAEQEHRLDIEKGGYM